MNGRFQKIGEASLLDLVFGCHCAFRPERAAVLIFHLDHTVRRGLESHQPGKGAVVHGLYNEETHRWSSGPAGVSVNTWGQINRELEEEGLICVSQKNGEPAEYTPQLAAIRIAIEQWRNRPAPHAKGAIP